MMVTNAESAGKRHFSDVHYRRTSLTPGRRHATTTTTNMDQKELEDRLAAAEALSSLGLPTFRDSNPAVPVENVSSGSAPKSEKAPKTRGKARAGRGKEEHSTGRETKSRSPRGRGTRTAKVMHDDVGATATNTAVSSPALTVSPDVRSDRSLLQQLTTPRTSSSRGGGGGGVSSDGSGTISGGRGSGRGGRGATRVGNSKTGNKLASPAVVVVPVSAGDVGGGVSVSFASASIASTAALHGASLDQGTLLRPAAAASAGSFVHHQNTADSTSSVTAVSVPRFVMAGGNRIVLPTTSTFPSTASTSLLSSSSSIPSLSSSVAAAPTAAKTSAAENMLSSGSAVLQKSTPIPIRHLPSVPLTAPTDNLPSKPWLPSLGLPTFSLGSSGLLNLPSIPNLPSLPSAPSLQLGTLEGSAGLKSASAVQSHDSSPSSQLSPHSRDGGEKSLPLKKRRIIESSALSSSSQPGPVSPMPPSPLVTSPAGAVAPVHAVATTSLAALDKSPEDAVTSPSPVPPVNILSQVLPPDMYRQLISEINTAITPDDDGDIPLHIAVVHENEVMVKKLIQLMALAGQRVDRYNKQHQTPLHLAVKLSSLSSMKMLMEAGADPNLVDSVGLTSTHMAVQGRDIDCLEALLQWSKYRCNLNNRNFEGLAPLHTAIINNDLEIATRLLDQSVDVNIMDGKSGRTALFHAAECNQKAAVELLLARSADPEIANYAGVVPAMAAQGRSHTTVARLLARALDEGAEEEKAEKSEVQYRHIPFELMIAEDGSRSTRPLVPELRRAQMAVQMKQQAAASSASSSTSSTPPLSLTSIKGQGQTPASSMPSILQSSSVSSNVMSVGGGGPAVTAGKVGSSIAAGQFTREISGETVAPSVARPPGPVTKAMHQQLPALITKLTSSSLPGTTRPSSASSPLSLPSVSMPRVLALTPRRNSSVDSRPESSSLAVAVKTEEREVAGGGSQAVGSALRTLVTARRLASRQAVIVGDGAGDRRFLATEAADKRGLVQGASPNPIGSQVHSLGPTASSTHLPLPTTTVTLSKKEALARVFCMQMKDIVDKQSNGGGAQSQGGAGGGGGGGGVVNMPLIPGVVPLHGLRTSVPLTSSSSASPSGGGAVSVASSSPFPSRTNPSTLVVPSSGAHQQARVAPLVIPPAPNLTSTSAAVKGMRAAAALVSPSLHTPLSPSSTPAPISLTSATSTPAAATPSEAHAQPTRPLLLFRSMWVEPGAGGEGGRRMGSVELRNVTPDDLRALQQSSTNMVNQTVASGAGSGASSTLQQQQLLQSFLTMASARPDGGGGGADDGLLVGGGGGGGGGVDAMETNRVPPVSNHVSRDSPQQLQGEQLGYGRADDHWDEEPKDLSLKSKKREKETAEDSSSPGSFRPKPELSLSSLSSSSTPVHRDSPESQRTTNPSSNRPSTGNGPGPSGKGERKRKAAAGSEDLPKPAKERKASRTKTAKSQPTAADAPERKKAATGPAGRAVKEALAGMVRGAAEKLQYGSAEISESKPVIKKPDDASEAKPVLLKTPHPPTKPALKNPGTVTSAQEKTTAAIDRSRALDLGSKKGQAKFGSDQNDNVKEKLPLGLGGLVQTTESAKIKKEVKPVEERMETK